MNKCADVVVWGTHAPSRAALGGIDKRIFVARAYPKIFGGGAENSTRGACAPRRYDRGLYAFVSIFCFIVAACRPDMMNQPKAKPLSESDFFSNQANARPIPPHTVEWKSARENDAFYTGLTNGTYVTELPVKLTPALLARGRERFEAMCAECHDRTGSGNGMVVLRGFPQPPSYHVPRLRNAPIGHFFDVITNGYGVMYSYATRVEPEDRWAIAAYIRALQLSQNANTSDLTVAERQKLENRK
jgi:mono/diheme cytochrome c family protein